MRSISVLLLGTAWLAEMASAQVASAKVASEQRQPDAVLPQQAADGLWLVAAGANDMTVMPTRAFSQGLTADGENRLWCLICAHSPADPNKRDVWLHRSSDGGMSWSRITKTPVPWATTGAIAGEPNSQILHVGWAGKRDGEAFASALYQRFDAAQGVWLGTPEVLQQASGEEDQFNVSDLVLAPDGVLTVMVATHRQPTNPPWPTAWSSGLMIRHSPEANWTGPFPVNTDYCGVWMNLQVQDGHAHATYRSSPGRTIIGYRSFALLDEKFDQKKTVEISLPASSGRSAGNASSFVLGPFGGRTVVYVAGAPSFALNAAAAANAKAARSGQLLIAFAGADDLWHTEVLCEDARLEGGNLAHDHFVLVRGPGAQVIALYSKISEAHRVLYRRILEHGRPMEPEREVARSDVAGAYYRLVGVRDARLHTGIWAIVGGTGDGERLGVRAVLAPRSTKTRWQ